MKLKQKRNAKLTLSDRIADALTVKPRADIEDDQVFGTKPQTVSRNDLGSSDSEEEAAISDFRKRNVNLLSEVSKKYAGQVVSKKDLEESSDASDDSTNEEEQDILSKIRKQIAEDSSEAEEDTKAPPKDTDSEEFGSDDVESDDYSITNFQKKSTPKGDKSSDDDDNDDDDGSDDEEGGIDISEMEQPVKENFEHVKKQNISEEAKKGACVRNQLLLWEGLLEMRIHLQRCMNTANRMPMSDTYKMLKESNEFVEESNSAKTNVANVLDKLLSLQNLLFKKYPDTKSLSTKTNNKQEDKESKKEESDEEIPSDTDNEEIPSDTEPEDNEEQETKTTKPIKETPTKKRKLNEYESELSKTHKAFKTFRDTAIQKWHDKTRLATATNIKNTPSNTILQQISYILSDREKLVRRTQLKRSEYEIVGYKPEAEEHNDCSTEVNPVMRNRKDNDEYIPEIFDDSDFYHQLLRELIECKSADISDPVQLSRQWIALQQMRSKMKRKVDTKATKGRKIKYVVHNQLVNYMAPEQSLSWNDESRNELYSSLFGKMFEQEASLNGNAINFYKLK